MAVFLNENPTKSLGFILSTRSSSVHVIRANTFFLMYFYDDDDDDVVVGFRSFTIETPRKNNAVDHVDSE